MSVINNLISQSPIHITTNTVLLIVLAIIGVYILINVISSIIKLIVVIAICWFILMSVQSTNIVNIPIINQAYYEMERVVPSTELWKQASKYLNYEENNLHNVNF